MLAIFYVIVMLLMFMLLARVCDVYFVKSLTIISKKLKLRDDVAGATFMAMGTSAPEFFTAAIALTTIGTENVGAGTIIGSAIFNILVIVGGSAAIRAAVLEKQPFLRDMSFYVLSLIVLYATFVDGVITFADTIIYLAVYAAYILVLSQRGKRYPNKQIDIAHELEIEEDKIEKKNGIIGKMMSVAEKGMDMIFPNLDTKPHLYWHVFAISIVLIIAASWVLVHSGIAFAHIIGVPEVIIGLTILAGGTSIPDLLASLITAKRGQSDMAVSNAIGSNTFDVLICLGLPWLVYILWTGNSVVVSTDGLLSSIGILFVSVFFVIAVIAFNKFRLSSVTGWIMIGTYCVYLGYQVFLAM